MNDALKIVGGVRVDWFKGDHPRLNPVFVTRYGFGNDTGFDDLDPVVLPRLGFTYNLPEFGVVRHSRLQGGVGIFSGGDPVVWFGNVFQNNGQAFAGKAPSPAEAIGRAARPASSTSSPAASFTGVPQLRPERTPAPLPRPARASPRRSIPISSCRPCGAPILAIRPIWSSATAPFGRGWHVNLDYVYSQYQESVHDRRPVAGDRHPNGTASSGFTIDGRPIYADHRSAAGRLHREAGQFQSDADLRRTLQRPATQAQTTQPRRVCADQCRRSTAPTSRRLSCRRTSTAASSRRAARATSRSATPTPTLTTGGTCTIRRRDRTLTRRPCSTGKIPTPSRALLREPPQHHLLGQPAGEVLRRSRDVVRLDLCRPFGPSIQPDLLAAGFRLFNASQSSSGNGNLVYLPSSTTDPNLSPTSNMTAVQTPDRFRELAEMRQEIPWPQHPAEHLLQRLVQGPRPALLAGASRAWPPAWLVRWHQGQAHRLCDVRQLPEFAEQATGTSSIGATSSVASKLRTSAASTRRAAISSTECRPSRRVPQLASLRLMRRTSSTCRHRSGGSSSASPTSSDRHDFDCKRGAPPSGGAPLP